MRVNLDESGGGFYQRATTSGRGTHVLSPIRLGFLPPGPSDREVRDVLGCEGMDKSDMVGLLIMVGVILLVAIAIVWFGAGGSNGA